MGGEHTLPLYKENDQVTTSRFRLPLRSKGEISNGTSILALHLENPLKLIICLMLCVIYSLTHLSPYLSIHTIHPPTDLDFQPTTHPPIAPCPHPSIYAPTYPAIHPSIHPSIQLPTSLSICSSIFLSFYLPSHCEKSVRRTDG